MPKQNPLLNIVKKQKEGKAGIMVIPRATLKITTGSFFFIFPSSFRICLHYIILPYCLQQKRSLILL